MEGSIQVWIVDSVDEIPMVPGRTILESETLTYPKDYDVPFAFLMTPEQVKTEYERVQAMNGKLMVTTQEPPLSAEDPADSSGAGWGE